MQLPVPVPDQATDHERGVFDVDWKKHVSPGPEQMATSSTSPTWIVPEGCAEAVGTPWHSGWPGSGRPDSIAGVGRPPGASLS